MDCAPLRQLPGCYGPLQPRGLCVACNVDDRRTSLVLEAMLLRLLHVRIRPVYSVQCSLGGRLLLWLPTMPHVDDVVARLSCVWPAARRLDGAGVCVALRGAVTVGVDRCWRLAVRVLLLRLPAPHIHVRWQVSHVPLVAPAAWWVLCCDSLGGAGSGLKVP